MNYPVDQLSAVERAARLRSGDLETHRFGPGRGAPPVVCGSTAAPGEAPCLLGSRGEALAGLTRLFADPTAIVAGAHLAYDAACLIDRGYARQVFAAYAVGRVHDVLLAEALEAIYGGHLGLDPRTGGELRKPSTGKVTNRYSLEIVSDLVLDRRDAKARDAWRTSYALLEGIPPPRWPKEAYLYPLDDARNTLDAAAAQLLGPPGDHAFQPIPAIPGAPGSGGEACAHCGEVLSFSGNTARCPKAPPRPPHRNLGNLAFQAEAALALHLGSCWGLRTDPEKVEALAAEVEEKHRRAVARFQGMGWVRPDGSEDQAAVKRAVAAAYGASGTCRRCGGSGRVRPIKEKPCRGQKARGRYPGCPGPACAVCGGEGKVYYPGDEVVCLARVVENRCPDCGALQFAHPAGGASCPAGHRHAAGTPVPGCDGTGFDLAGTRILPRTDKGGISANRDTLLESGDDELAAYGDDEFEKIRTTQVPWLRTGIDQPLSYGVNALLASGRCSYEGSPAHQMTREGGERECIRARGLWCGYPVECVLGSTDYGAGELCALAQVNYWKFGYSEMLRFINETGDPGVLHSVLGAEVLGITLDEFLRRYKEKEKAIALVRQAMKPISFGAPAAMGSAKIVLTSRLKNAGFTVCEAGPARNRKGEPGYWGIRFCATVGGRHSCGDEKITVWKRNDVKPICRACVEVVEYVLKPAYFKRFPEIRDYHEWGKRSVEAGALSPTILFDADLGRPRVVRERGGCELSAFLNTPFQSMIADITKSAYVAATRECYLGEKADGSPSPLAGCRLPLFVHDELVSELPLETAHISGPRITEIMESTASRLAPDCRAWKADTALMFWLAKGAEPVEVNGKLIPWDQEKMNAWRERHRAEGRVAA